VGGPFSFYQHQHGSLNARNPESCVINTDNSYFIAEIVVNNTGSFLLVNATSQTRIVTRAVPALVAGSSQEKGVSLEKTNAECQ
jgi:hypothetical protein